MSQLERRARYSLRYKIVHLEWMVIFLALLLACWGIAMLYSAAGGAMTPWAGKQLVRLVIGVLGMVVVAVLPMRWVFGASYLAYLAVLSLLVAVEVMGFIGMGAQRWLNVGGIALQPSEFMKPALVLALARFFHTRPPEQVGRLVNLIPALALIGLPVVLILRQPNLGTASITAAVGVTVVFMAGLKARYFIVSGLGVLALIPVAWQLLLHDYQKQRVLTFLNPEADPLGAGYNIMQSKIAIGAGGVVGTGYMQGSQSQLGFLPEKHTDFIFTMIAEEFGFLGGAGVLLLFALILGYGLWIAMTAGSRFGALVASGIVIILFLHVLINTGMVMGLLPVVGVPLPLLSYGGTMLWAVCLSLGLLLNVHIHSRGLPRY